MAGHLIGGGDGGGIVITAGKGIRVIPPWEPGVRFRLAALSELLRAAEHAKGPVREEIAELSHALSAHLLRDAQEHVGELDEHAGLIRVSEDGIDICGNEPRHIRLGGFIPPPGPIPDPIGPVAERAEEIA